MTGKYKVVTLCGSTRFKEEYIEAQKRLTLAGNIVISVGLFGHSGDDDVWKPGVKEMLDDMHLRKIDMADEVFVVNPGGYIGESTRREIAYARQNGKSVTFLCGEGDGCYYAAAAFYGFENICFFINLFLSAHCATVSEKSELLEHFGQYAVIGAEVA